MAQFTKEELDKIFENHRHWLAKDCENWENMKANLCEADLSGANFYGANLYRAILCRADLSGANLREADLRGADLCGANLYRADLRGADLREADLYRAILCRADLREADLYRAILYRADLRGADLREANLCGANLREANLREANLCGAINIPFMPMACPDTGSFTGWKAALRLKGDDLDEIFRVIVELEILAPAKRSSATGRKCRCDKAIVKSIASIDGSESFDSAFSKHDPNFIYRVGEVVSVDNFDGDRFNECAPGIHFFINRQEAVDYKL